MEKGRKEKMRVLVFSHNFPPAIDGGSKLLSLVARELKSQGNQVLVLTSDAYSSDDYLNTRVERVREFGDFWGIRVIRLWTWRWGKAIIRRITGPIFVWAPWLEIYRFKPQKIIAGVFPTLIPIYAWILARLLRVKLVLVPCFHQKERGFYRPWLGWVLRRADQIWALTQKEKSFYQKKFGIASRKILVFKPKIEADLFLNKTQEAKFSEPPTIVFVGSQAAHKRIEWLIEAFEKLKFKLESKEVERRKLKLKLILVGPKTLYSPKIEAKIKKLPQWVRKDIKALGRVSEKKKLEVLDQAWVLVNPSAHESLGLVFFEAWARKKPVIGARMPVLEEVIDDGKNGLLFQKDDLEDLAEKIEMIITNKKLARKMGEAGYKKLVNSE